VELAEHIAGRAGSPHLNILADQPLDAVAEYLYQQPGYGKAWVREAVIQLLIDRHREARGAGPAHALLTRHRWRTIFTTNYDRLVEIAYETDPDRVQEVLPVYAPDLLNLRHEEQTVLLVKLNGSFDEARRNSRHELILTFSEQQDALSRNAEFYRLLKEEAVNGPIIFVGFRFVHPGASLAGTSPEFQQLRGLLRELGPAASWHYCVCPFKADTPSAQLAMRTLQASQDRGDQHDVQRVSARPDWEAGDATSFAGEPAGGHRSDRPIEHRDQRRRVFEGPPPLRDPRVVPCGGQRPERRGLAQRSRELGQLSRATFHRAIMQVPAPGRPGGGDPRGRGQAAGVIRGRNPVSGA